MSTGSQVWDQVGRLRDSLEHLVTDVVRASGEAQFDHEKREREAFPDSESTLSTSRADGSDTDLYQLSGSTANSNERRSACLGEGW